MSKVSPRLKLSRRLSFLWALLPICFVSTVCLVRVSSDNVAKGSHSSFIQDDVAPSQPSRKYADVASVAATDLSDPMRDLSDQVRDLSDHVRDPAAVRAVENDTSTSTRELSPYGGWVFSEPSTDSIETYSACLCGSTCKETNVGAYQYAWKGYPKAVADEDMRTLVSKHLRGKRIVLVGDSLMDLQHRSFRCLLASFGYTPQLTNESRCWEYPSLGLRSCYPETMYYIFRSSTNLKTVRRRLIDSMDACPSYVLLNTGAHWTESALQRECNGNPSYCAKLGFDNPIQTYGRVLKGISTFFQRYYAKQSKLHPDWCSASGRKPLLIFQTSTVSHFDTFRYNHTRGGYIGKPTCHEATRPATSEELKRYTTIAQYQQQQAAMTEWHRTTDWTGIPTVLVDATPLSLHRPDAHPKHANDCLHMSMPGVPDWINRVVLNHIFEHEARQH